MSAQKIKAFAQNFKEVGPKYSLTAVEIAQLCDLVIEMAEALDWCTNWEDPHDCHARKAEKALTKLAEGLK